MDALRLRRRVFLPRTSTEELLCPSLPGPEKRARFKDALQRKLDNFDFNFRGVWFPDELSYSKFHFKGDCDFGGAIFSSNAEFVATTFDGSADFLKATFTGEVSFANAVFLAEVDFYGATFRSDADFRAVTFGASAEFRRATFSGKANFRHATFTAKASFMTSTFTAKTDFSNVIFHDKTNFQSAAFNADVEFSSATFDAVADFLYAIFPAKADFSDATFRDYVKFAGNQNSLVFDGESSLDLQFARIEKPDHLSFHTLVLRPHWFVNIDSRKFEFTNVKWLGGVNQELGNLRSEDYGLVAPPHRLLAIACRNLAVNAEENHRYEEASKFRYMSMEARRLEIWKGLAPWRLSWWYWLASGYGERALKAFLVLLGVWFIAALLYTRIGFASSEPKRINESDAVAAKRDEVGVPLQFPRALNYSAGVMTLQKPEPRPATTAAQTVVLLETILGPVQVALVALAIRRKFMR